MELLAKMRRHYDQIAFVDETYHGADRVDADGDVRAPHNDDEADGDCDDREGDGR